jgi:hypothetical protein
MLKILKKWWFWVIVLVVIFFILASGGEKFENPIIVGEGVLQIPVEGIQDSLAIIQEEGWSEPVKLQASDEGREDSTYITRDGRYVLFYYDPIVGEFQESTAGIKADPKIYYSERPFITKQIHPVSTDDVNAEVGPYISESGDLYYTSTFIELEPTPHVAMPNKNMRNNEIIDMGTGEAEGDPHYCDSTQELYADVYFPEQEDQDLAVFKDGKTTIFPEPINLPNESAFQPFLTDDCQTLYFTSTRGRTQSIFPLQVYRSQRLGEFEWSEPELFIKFPDTGVLGGVGEFSMTRDSKQMVFLQLTINGSEGQNDMYYSEKK